MRAKRQDLKDKQIQGFVSELETLSKKYGVVISVDAKFTRCGNIKDLQYGIGGDYNSKIYVKNVEYKNFEFYENKRFNVKPSDNTGFYRFCERELNDPITALEHWELVHSLITQISGAKPNVIRDYMDYMGYQMFHFIFKKDKTEQIESITKTYINHIDYSLTQFLNNYEEYKEAGLV